MYTIDVCMHYCRSGSNLSIRRRLVEHGDVQRAAKETITKVQNLGSIDNISVAVICLNQFAHHL